MVGGWARGSDQLQPALGWVVEPHLVPATSLSGVAGWPKLPSTAGKPQPATLFPL